MGVPCAEIETTRSRQLISWWSRRVDLHVCYGVRSGVQCAILGLVIHEACRDVALSGALDQGGAGALGLRLCATGKAARAIVGHAACADPSSESEWWTKQSVI